MTNSYKITNLTSCGCITKVKSQLLKHPGILPVEVSFPLEYGYNNRRFINGGYGCVYADNII